MDDPALCTAIVLYAEGDEGSANASVGAATSPPPPRPPPPPPAAVIVNGGRGASASGPLAAASHSVVAGIGALEARVAAGSSSASPPQQQQPPRFVGLSNQGATCYMNSLLQTLYMTPEVRSSCVRCLCVSSDAKRITHLNISSKQVHH